MPEKVWKKLILCGYTGCLLLYGEHPSLGQRNNGFYQDPFDTGAGGSVMTWSTQESMLMNNPALLPYGGKFFRWMGMKINLMPGKDSVDLTQELGKRYASGGSTETTTNTAGSFDETLNTLIAHPIHLGASSATSFITSKGGVCAFFSAEPDIRAWKHGDPEKGSGTPSVVVHNEIYGGLYASLAEKSFMDWLSFGISAKYLMANESVTRIDVLDREQIDEIQNNPQKLSDLTSFSSGTGLDGSFLIFLQSSHVDLRLSGAVANAGGLSLSGGSGITYPQMFHGGVGLTLHTEGDALHFSADYRDISDTLGEPLYRHLYTGMRLTLRTYLGLSAGLYHGNPSYGAELDLLLFRLAASVYTREYGQSPGTDPRKIYILSTSFGATF